MAEQPSDYLLINFKIRPRRRPMRLTRAPMTNCPPFPQFPCEAPAHNGPHAETASGARQRLNLARVSERNKRKARNLFAEEEALRAINRYRKRFMSNPPFRQFLKLDLIQRRRCFSRHRVSINASGARRPSCDRTTRRRSSSSGTRCRSATKRTASSASAT